MKCAQHEGVNIDESVTEILENTWATTWSDWLTMATSGISVDTKARLYSCWDLDIQWDLYPEKVTEVSVYMCYTRSV